LPLSSGQKFLPVCTTPHRITEYCNLNIHHYQNIAPQVYSAQSLGYHCYIPVFWLPENFLIFNFSAVEEQNAIFMSPKLLNFEFT